MDLSTLSDAELEAIASGNLSKFSDATLQTLAAQESPAPAPAPAPAPEAAPQSRLQSFLSAASRTYIPELGITSPELAAAERQGMVKIAPEVVRYGVPLAVGAATAPVSVPATTAALLGNLAFTSGVGAGSSYLSDLGAQALEMMAGERKDISQREAISQGVLGATPFIGSGAGRLGSIGVRSAINVPSAMAASETSRYITNPEAYSTNLSESTLENVMRFLPAASAGSMTVVGGGGAGISRKGQMAQSIREGSQQAQQEFGVTMGRAPLLQDLFGGTATPAPGGGFIANIIEPAAIERAAIQRANPKALEAMENALVGPSEGFAALARSAPDLFPLTEDVRKSIGVLEPAYQRAKASREAANQLTQQAQDLQIKGQAGASEALELARVARLKAYADEATYDLTWKKVLGNEAPSIKQVSLGERNVNISKAGEAAKDAREQVVSEAYKKAGIGENDGIVSIEDILAAADEKITSNASRAEFKSLIKEIFKLSDADIVSSSALLEIDKRLGLSAVNKSRIILDRTTFLEARNKLASEITKREPSIKPSLATRKANQYYQTMKEAAETYIGRVMPDRLKPYQEATARAARFFDIEQTDAFKLLEAGDAAGFYKAAKATGASEGSIYAQAMQFTQALRQEGAAAVADGLEAAVNKSIRDGILDSVVEKGSGFRGARIVRAHELVKELQTLHESGFPIGKLKLGKVDDIRSLARISSTSGAKGYTTAELGSFLDNVERLGLDRANAKLNYERAVRNSFLETDPARRLKEAQKKRIEARKAGLTAQQEEAIAKQMESDPLIKFLNEPGSVTSMGILNDPAKNADLVETVFSLEPTMVSRFMDSLRAGGRVTQAEDLEKAVIARMFGKFGKGTQEIDLTNVLDAFRNPANQGTLNSLKSVLGPERFASLKDNLVKPLDQLAKSYERAGQPLPSSFYQLRTAIVAASVARGQSFSQSLAGTFIGANALRGAFEALQNKQYNLLYTLFIDPKTAPKVARAGYVIDKVMQQPTLATAVKLAQYRDAQEQQAEPQP